MSTPPEPEASTSRVPSLGGYDCDFVEEPPDSLKCLICMLVVKEPWQHGECGRLYCAICIKEYAKTKNTCPNCRQKRPSLFRDGRSECLLTCRGPQGFYQMKRRRPFVLR